MLASISLERSIWPEVRRRATELCPAAVSISNSHCCIGSASRRAKLSQRQPATLPTCMVGVTSGASSRGVSPTCLSSAPTLVAILQPWATSIESSSGVSCSIGNLCSKHVTRRRQSGSWLRKKRLPISTGKSACGEWSPPLSQILGGLRANWNFVTEDRCCEIARPLQAGLVCA